MLRSGRTPGNSIGHSGSHELRSARTHMIATISASNGFSARPSTPNTMRSPTDPGPNTAARSSQYGKVQKGHTTIDSTTTAQVPIGLTTLAIGRTTRAAVSYTHLRAHETPEHLVC